VESLKLSWLGHPLVELKGRAIKLETRKAAALLAYLSLNPGECPREVLATMFWQEGNQQKALANLRRTLSSLNSSLPGWIEADRDSIALKRNGKLWVDVEAFHQSLSQPKEHQHPENEVCDDCLSTLDKAGEHYRGDFMDGLNLMDAPTFDDWQFFQRDGLRQEFADVLQRLTFGHSERGQWEQAIACARRWVAMDRLHEPACRALMDLYARSGQRAAAVHQYEELARLLNQQMGQEPEEETHRLYDQIRGREEAKQVVESSERSISFPLLKTKLYIPTAPASRVTRPHLIERLDELKKKALTIVSAPAGFGKTTLLAEWIDQTSLPVAWLSLDNGDNDPYRFLAYMIAALESIHEYVGLEARQIMQSNQLRSPLIMLASLLNDLGKVTEPYVLILDDYQFITEHAVHETMAYLLDHLPSNMHLVISTRADPPLQLGRLRAYDQMLELRTTDLRFTSEEATAFLNEIMHLELSVEDIEALETRTEGWVVGLKMAAVSLQVHPNRAQFINTFSGTHRYILDYLLEEVLNVQSEEVKSFLLYTSILGQLNGALCNTITGRMDSYQILEKLEKENLFLTPMDDERQWYRYHHLFADLLRSSLEHRNPDIIPELHIEASKWYESKDLMEEAIHHALTTRNYDRAVSIIQKISENIWLNGEYYKLLRWLRTFPQEQVRNHPRLCLWYAWSLTQTGPLHEAKSWVDAAEREIERQIQKASSYPQDDLQALRQEIACLRIALASLEGDHEKVLELAIPAIDQPIPKDHLSSLIIRGSILHGLSSSYYAAGELSKTEHMCQETARVTGEIGYLIRYIPAYNKQAHVYKVTGRLHQSEQILLEQLDQMRLRGMGEHYTIGNLYCRLADLYYEWNRLEDAQQMLDKCHENNKAVQLPYLLVDYLHVKSRLLMLQKDFDGAQTCLSRAAQLIQQYYIWPQLVWENESYQGRLWFTRGDRKGAVQWCNEHPQANPGKISFAEESIEISRARIFLNTGELDRALGLLQRLEESAEAGGRYARLIEILVVKAVVLKEKGDSEEAHGTLMQALDQARIEEYIRTFVDEGELLKEMIQGIQVKLHGHKRSKSQDQFDAYLDQLIQAFSPDPISRKS
jgi:LuxR family maltose regulon positive regulatory protein